MKQYNYKPFFEATRKLLKEQYEDFNDVPEDVVEFFTSNVKVYDHYYAFYDGEYSNLQDTKAGLQSDLVQRLEDYGFQTTTLELYNNDNYQIAVPEGSVIIGDYSLGSYTVYHKVRNKVVESTNWRDYPEEEGEENANEADLYPHRYGMLKDWIVIVTVGRTDYINSYEEEDNAYETIHNIAVGTETLSITFKDGSRVVMDSEGRGGESLTIQDVRLAKVDDKEQGFLFDDPEHQISEKTGIASQFDEICQGFSDSYDVYHFAKVICDF